MNKNNIVEMLEKHVQWIALGIGGLWLLYMVYTYVIVADSSTVEVAGQNVNAATVDKMVQEKAYQLREKTERPDRILDTVDDYGKRIAQQLEIPTPQPWQEVFVQVPGGQVLRRDVGQEQGPQMARKIDVLPKPPKATGIDALPLRSVVRLPGAPQVDPQMGGGQPVEQDAQLLSYVVVSANFPMAELGKEFARVIDEKHPLPLKQTVLLKVELVREELQSDGSWGKPVVIPSHDFTPQQQSVSWPRQDRAEQMNFLQTAIPNQPSVAQPKFVQPLRGDIWRLPGTPAPQVAPANAPPQPEPDMMDEPPARPNVTPRQPNRPPTQQPTPRPRPGRRSDASPAFSHRVVTVAQTFDEPPPPRTPMPGAPGMGNQPGGMMNQRPGVAAPVIPPANQPGEVPKSAFDPNNAHPFPMWVTDITVEPGKTYRYRIRYTIKNPAFAYDNACQPQDLANTFAIDSELSEPTNAITIPNTTMYFAVAAPKLGREIRFVQFEVYTWTVDGLVQAPTKDTTAVPGDMIDPTQNVQVTLVDMRDDGRTIVLLDQNGRVFTRNVNVDANSPDLAECRRIIKEQAVAPVAGR